VTDIFKEVEEELKKEQAAHLWSKYGRYVIAAAVAVVLATAGFNLWVKWDQGQREERSDAFAAAAELAAKTETQAALAGFAKLGGPDGAYGTLAVFERARLLAGEGDVAGAIALWDQLATDDKAGSAFKSLATVLSVLHQIDDGDGAALTARLDPLTRAGDGYRPIALELTAALALRGGDRARARDLYTLIADDLSAPAGMRARAAQMLEALKE
jgi:hypothetical protein